MIPIIYSPEKLISGHLSLNLRKNKFGSLKNTSAKAIDILLISETNLNNSFSSAQFIIIEFSAPFPCDRKSKRAQLLM